MGISHTIRTLTGFGHPQLLEATKYEEGGCTTTKVSEAASREYTIHHSCSTELKEREFPRQAKTEFITTRLDSQATLKDH